jgi:hypothetical protein
MSIRRHTIALVLALAPSALGQTSLVTITPVQEGLFGGSASGSTDLNGDGLGDAIVGAPGETVNGIESAGRVYVYSGVNGALIRTLVSPTPTIGGAFGASVASVPDTNGDGVADIAVGAPDEPGGGVLASGKVYLFSGATGSLLWVYISPGRRTSGGFGTSVAGVADCTGDGRGDVIIGAPNENSGGVVAAGRAYIFSGRSGGLWRVLAPPIPQNSAQFGFSVAGVDDLNDDHFGDAIVGAPREHPNGTPVNSGRVHVFSGHTGVRLYSIQSAGMAQDGFFGEAVAGMGDADGDGRSDFVVGAPLEHPGASPLNCGRAYIISGRAGNLWKKLLPPTPVANGQFGIAVAGVPDTNTDGHADAMVGAWQEGTPVNSGRVHVYSGFTGLRLFSLQSPNAAINGRFGVAVAGMPNAGATSRGDFLIGASTEEAAGQPSSAGRAYIFRR